ncbi:MAG: hypothetical protein Q9213_001233 [Squamulea squamosa]
MPGPIDVMPIDGINVSHGRMTLQGAIQTVERKASLAGVKKLEEYATFVANMSTVTSMVSHCRSFLNYNPRVTFLHSSHHKTNRRAQTPHPPSHRIPTTANEAAKTVTFLGAEYQNHLHFHFYENFTFPNPKNERLEAQLPHTRMNRQPEVMHYIVRDKTQFTEMEWQIRYWKMISYILVRAEQTFELQRMCTSSVFMVLPMGGKGREKAKFFTRCLEEIETRVWNGVMNQQMLLPSRRKTLYVTRSGRSLRGIAENDEEEVSTSATDS